MSQFENIEEVCNAAGIRIINYVPGNSLKIKCETHWAAKILLAVFSLMFFAVGAQFAAWVLGFLGDWVRQVCAVIALACWVWLSYRGVWITLNLAESGYRLRTMVEAEFSDGWPTMEIKSSQEKGVWEARLWCAGHEVGKPQRNTDREVAEGSLRAFATLFASRDTAFAGLKSDVATQTEQLDEHTGSIGRHEDPIYRDRKPNFDKQPVIYLIHGTFAPNAPWTDPVSSELVDGLNNSGIEAEYRRFQWSGRNRVIDRKEGGARLAEEIGPILDNRDRAVVLIGHSHGGNVALEAGKNLTAPQCAGLRYCFLATPFLSSNRRFDIWNYYLRLPRAIRDNLQIAVQAVALLLTFLVYISLQDLLLPDELHLGFSQQTSKWTIFPALLWILGVPWLSSRAIDWVLSVTDPSNSDRHESPILNSRNSLVCAYSNDEPYMALSALSNLMSFVQIGIFKIADGIISLLRWTRFFEVFWSGAWLLIWLGMVFGFFVGGVLFFLQLLLGPQAMTELQSVLGNLLPDRNNFPIGALLLVMVAALLLVGFLLLIFLSILVGFGLIRFLLFWFAGVVDQIVTQRDLIETWLGSVSISAVPFGDIRIRYLPGNQSFNHSEIYKDPDCHVSIAAFVRESSAPV